MGGNNRTMRPLVLPASFSETLMTPDEWDAVRAFQSDPDRLLLIVRFWAKVEMRGVDECWESREPLDARPTFSWKGQGYIAARVAYELAIGPLPPGMFACHSCDNGQCLNPKHLVAGTIQENDADIDRRGRRPRGEAHYRSKLTADQVREIRRRYAAGEARQAALARDFGVNQENISQILLRRTWKHIEDFVPTSGQRISGDVF